MRRVRPATFAGFLALAVAVSAQPTGDLVAVPQSEIPLSLRKEAEAALQRGAAYLIKTQQTDGSWRDFAAITALAGIALHGCNLPDGELARRIAVEKARQRVLASVQPDGAICPPNRMYANYSTSVCLAGLAVFGLPEDAEVMRQARCYLIGQQLDRDHPDQPVDEDSASYGGFGYGGQNRAPRGGRQAEDRADLSCTQWALEALYLTDHLDRTPEASDREAKEADLCWEKALVFLGRVQNLEQTGASQWIVTAEKDGGFTYLPAREGQTDASYGSMTYAGLKSMIYAKLERDDPRVRAALDWVRQRYSVDENPGQEANGLYYYLHTMTKALAVWGGDELEDKDGKRHNWRADVVRKLVSSQKGEGEWANEHSARWQESDPQLVTAYAMITLEIALADR
ncbi:MAG: terpene cyclase/mutase family protein [Lentisphaeria bacterium]|jgi:squalene-hopene/tetraprenyl-beta-curcumene cyclase|nr:terpene cyclase/mutase family protein [Lentisphaeria bacterium]